jgi:hypothetical protein
MLVRSEWSSLEHTIGCVGLASRRVTHLTLNRLRECGKCMIVPHSDQSPWYLLSTLYNVEQMRNVYSGTQNNILLVQFQNLGYRRKKEHHIRHIFLQTSRNKPSSLLCSTKAIDRSTHTFKNPNYLRITQISKSCDQGQHSNLHR